MVWIVLEASMYNNLNEEGWPDMTVFERQTILKKGSLILCVSFKMDDVVMKLVPQWSPVKTKIISRPTDH